MFEILSSVRVSETTCIDTNICHDVASHAVLYWVTITGSIRDNETAKLLGLAAQDILPGEKVVYMSLWRLTNMLSASGKRYDILYCHL